jgi:hypothetical protein
MPPYAPAKRASIIIWEKRVFVNSENGVLSGFPGLRAAEGDKKSPPRPYYSRVMIVRYREDAVIFVLGGVLYASAEILFRGWTHPSMLLVGGLCVLLIGKLDVLAPGLPLAAQAAAGAAIVTALELASGLVVNVWLGWNVWDYSARPLNVMGQICPLFSLLWVPASLFAAFADDALRRALFCTPIPPYRWF